MTAVGTELWGRWRDGSDGEGKLRLQLFCCDVLSQFSVCLTISYATEYRLPQHGIVIQCHWLNDSFR
ncbi:hypothetical protein vseg_007068 [Gypsophila vaccaria]